MSDATPLATDAFWLPHRLVDEGQAIRFVRADREQHRSATFLDDQYLDPQAPRRDAATPALLSSGLTTAPAPLHFVFHSAFACSTLLARAFDVPGWSMGLKEPAVLNDAARLRRERRLSPALLDLVLRLLGRPVGRGEAVVIKPSNVANILMGGILRARPEARAILLYRDLPAFLRSIAGKGMFGRIWARRHLATIRAEAPFDAGFSDLDVFVQTDLQAAAFGWLIQQAQFAALSRDMPGQVKVLAAAELLAEKRVAMTAALNWFGIAAPASMVDAIVDGPAFREDAKRPGVLLGQGDERRPAPASSQDAEEIDMVVAWTMAVAAHVGVALVFGPRLVA